MSPRKNLGDPTEAELEILAVLWDRGPSTVREVHDALERDTGYTTTLKLMQLMVGKGLAVRNASQRSHVYRAVTSKHKTQRRLVRGLIDKAFGGSAGELALRALSTKRASAEELSAIRDLLDDLEDRS